MTGRERCLCLSVVLQVFVGGVMIVGAAIQI